jgi:Bacteriophage head-tail adaptor
VITAGQLDKLVNLESAGEPVADGTGGFTDDWQPLNPAQMWVRIDAASQADQEAAAAAGGTVIGQSLFTIGLFYHPQVTLKTRLRYQDPDRGERTFQVISMRDPDTARRELTLVCAELHP